MSSLTGRFGPNSEQCEGFLARLEALTPEQQAVLTVRMSAVLMRPPPKRRQAIAALRLVIGEHGKDRSPFPVPDEDELREPDRSLATAGSLAFDALIYRDLLAPEHVQVLYQPFAEIIPLESLTG